MLVLCFLDVKQLSNYVLLLYLNSKMQTKFDCNQFMNTKMAILSVAAVLCTNAWAQESRQLIRDGGASAVSYMQVEGLAGAVRLSSQCLSQVRAGQQFPHFCLGVETASMLMLAKGQVQSEDKTLLSWFDGDAVTGRVLSYCYTYLGLSGDMQCLEQMSQAKAVLQALTEGESAPRLKGWKASP